MALLDEPRLDGDTTVEGTNVLSTGEVGGTKYLREDGDGTSSWQAAAGGGDVSKVGIPVDDQVGVWTGDGTIEGATNLTYDGSSFLLTHTATENDDHALEIVCDAAGFGDVKGLDIDFITGAVAATEDEEAILINIDETATTGGEIKGIEVLATGEGSAEVIAVDVGIGIKVLQHNVGTFGNMDSALVLAVDQLSALSSGGAGSISMFVNDNDTVTIGDAAQFAELEVIIATGASGAGISPTWEYSTGIDTWATFSPSDGTNAFKNTGVVLWEVANLAGFAVGTGSEFLIRITRTRNTITTTPIVDTFQISATSLFYWDKNASVKIDTLEVETAIVSTANANISVLPNGTGNVVIGTVTLDADQVVGAGQDNYVLTYDNGTGLLSLEAAGASHAVQTVNVQDGAVATGTTITPLDDTVPQVSEGTEFMTLAITPGNTANLLKIEVVACLSPVLAGWIILHLHQDDSTSAISSMIRYITVGGGAESISFTYWMAAGTVSATTFNFRVGPASSDTITFNGTGGSARMGGTIASTMTITEYLP